jgi:Transmembrane domain of unknown function (DUF3566)
MTERSAEQAPVQTRPDTDTAQDTARIPLAERLQRRISAASDEHRNGSSGRVLPPPPPELAQQSARPAERTAASNGHSGHTEETQALTAQPQERAVQPAPAPTAPPTAPATGAPTAAPSAAPTAPPTARTRRRTSSAPARAPRRARLRLSRIDPWSVMKVSFLLSIAFGIVTVVSVFMVWSVLGAAGVWTSINNTVSDTVSSGNNVSSSFNIEDYLGLSRVLGFTMLVSVIDVILITAIATLGAFLYNMAASLLGGIEVTLAEDA